MPRTKRLIRKRWSENVEVLGYELERSLLHGEGCIGTALELRTLEDWKRHWSQWRDVILPKVLEHRPGTRPFAMYVVGEIPARPVLRQPPMEHRYFRLYVPSVNGTGVWHCDYPEPYMQNETMYLRDLGVVTDDEYQRARTWWKRGGCTYPDELGAFE